MDQNEMSNLYRGPSIDASYQVSYHLASEEKLFQKSTNKKQELPMMAMFANGSNGMSNSHRGPSIDVSYHVSE
jgi:hypothetical protein